MSIESHLSELVRRHQTIEHAIARESAYASPNDLKLHELKRKKLVLKDEIAKLERVSSKPTHH